MNTQDRQKAAELIRQEFSSRRSELQDSPTEEMIFNQSYEITRQLGIQKQIARIEKLEAEALKLRIEVSANVDSLHDSLEGNKKRKRNQCDCSKNFEYTLRECAAIVARQELNHEKQRDDLFKQERTLLASVLTCQTDEELLSILKKAGLQ